jgi:hypothetical protein
MRQRFLCGRAPLLLLFVVLVLAGGIIFFLHHAQADLSTVSGRDASRISDLQQVQTQLEAYFNKCGYYPGAVQAKTVCSIWIYNNTWEGLSDALLNSNIGVETVPNDPASNSSYFFESAPDGKGYAIGAMLEDPTNPTLTQSVHGNIDGLNCGPSMYCLTASK